jgi:peptidoglycan/xylan/chitin deacetylase (PgdA/CDA1 family)
MTWSEIRELAAHGVTIGAHSASHMHMAEAPAAAIAADTARSNRRFMDEPGSVPDLFAYPYGEVSRAARRSPPLRTIPAGLESLKRGTSSACTETASDQCQTGCPYYKPNPTTGMAWPARGTGVRVIWPYAIDQTCPPRLPRSVAKAASARIDGRLPPVKRTVAVSWRPAIPGSLTGRKR